MNRKKSTTHFRQ